MSVDTELTPEQMASLDSIFQAGLRAMAQGDYKDAVERFSQIIDDGFSNAVLLTTYGNALKGLKLFDKAVAACKSAVELDSGNMQALMNLGSAHLAAGDWQNAKAVYQGALGLFPGESEIHFNLGTAWLEGNELDEARSALQRAVALDRESFQAWVNLGAVRKRLGDFEGSREAYAKAVGLDPDEPRAQWNLSLAELSDGDYARGWDRYEWRQQVEDIPVRDFPMTRWDGRMEPASNLLIHSEQGLGDTLQFVRLLKFAKERVRNVCLLAPRPLCPILKHSGIADYVAGDTSELPPCHMHLPLLSLPRLTGNGFLGAIDQVPYLQARRDLVESWSKALDGDSHFKIGICWQGNPGYKEDRSRSVPLLSFESLCDDSDVELWALQKGSGLEQVQSFGPSERLRVQNAEFDVQHGAFMDTAALASQMNLIVTSDTSVAHLVGGMGLPVWLALPFVSDWRWGQYGDLTPWYPSMRLFRQDSYGDWSGVFRRISDALVKFKASA
ncbi:MAG: tetratricopeptide repeat protein [Deltaproteobacteria bacterium]|nr:tetratricopeptide repeat protein [Deltaproteobacteria bacterium]MBT6488912.1 tetratricopeptide repeat protein [Deltaproteobacteria bacterium]